MYKNKQTTNQKQKMQSSWHRNLLISSKTYFFKTQNVHKLSLEKRHNVLQLVHCSHSLIPDRGAEPGHGAHNIVGIVKDVKSLILHLLADEVHVQYLQHLGPQTNMLGQQQRQQRLQTNDC